MRDRDHDEPAESGEVDAKLHVLIVSTRVSMVGEDSAGDVAVAHDLVELLMAVAEERRMVVLFDTKAPSLDLEFFGRIARDFPPQIAILVRGGGEDARTRLYGCGVYRARCYAPAASAPCDQNDGPLVLDVSDVLERVRRRLDIPATIPVGSLG
jgi:hypothetical protein